MLTVSITNTACLNGKTGAMVAGVKNPEIIPENRKSSFISGHNKFRNNPATATDGFWGPGDYRAQFK